MKGLSLRAPLSIGIYDAVLLLVAFCWGVDPLVYSYLFRHYSATVLASVCAVCSALLFLAVSFKKLKLLDRHYAKIALPIGLVNSLACVLQKIGLQYTTPANYAFLEHLSCVTVPLIMFFVLKRKPTKRQWIACFLCLFGCLILTGAGSGSSFFGIGDLLCASAGILLGIGIVMTGRYTKKLDVTLLLTVHMIVYAVTSVLLTAVLHCIRVDGAPIEKIVFSFDPIILLIAVFFGLLSVGVCWLLKTEATRHTDPSTVAAIGPVSAVVTAILSVCMGSDTLTFSLVLASCMIFLAAFLTGKEEGQEHKKE